MFEWDAIDREAEAEGFATKRAFKQPRPKSGRSKQPREYRVKNTKGILRRLRVIDGKSTL